MASGIGSHIGSHMFLPMKQIASTVGLPFLSQAEDQQLLFRIGKNGVKRLAGSEVIPVDDVEYWSQYYTLFDSAADVSSLITIHDIRQALVNQPLNLRTLLLLLSHHIFTLLPSNLFPTPAPIGSSSAFSSLSKLAPSATKKLSRQDPTKEVLNCLRVLGRILVVVFEGESETGDAGGGAERDSRVGTPMEERDEPELGQGQGEDDRKLRENFAWEVLWKRMPVPPASTAKESFGDVITEEPQFSLGDDEGDDTPTRPKANAAGGPPPLAIDTEAKEAWASSPTKSFSTPTPASPATPTARPRGHSRSMSRTTPLLEGEVDPLTGHAAKVEVREERKRRRTLEMQGKPQGLGLGLVGEDETLPSLADRLFSCTLDLLFCAGFTVPEGVRGEGGKGDKINYVIWEKGIGSTVNLTSTPELDRNKAEVLRFLLILLSSTIYTPPHTLPHSLNRPLRYLSHALERRLVLSLMCSWLNTALNSSNGGLGEAIPYNYLIFKGGEERKTLVKMGLMCLLVALDHWGDPEGERDVQGRAAGETLMVPGMAGLGLNSDGQVSIGEVAFDGKKDGNAFRYFISKLHRKDDFVFILDGILAVLAEYTAVANGILPGSKKPVPYVMEMLMLFWKLIDLNKRFRTHLNESGKNIDIVGYILICCLENKDNPAQHGLLRMLSYILQTLSSDPAFGASLNQPQRLPIPTKWSVPGTTADLLIVSMYSIATTTSLNPLFQPLTIAIANVAPYLKGVGVQASTRLLQLFKAFSAASFLLSDEGHPRLVYYLLETFNGILFYQLDENPNLVYAILRAHQDFQALGTFTLASGLREIQRKREAAKRAAAAGEKSKLKLDPSSRPEKQYPGEDESFLPSTPPSRESSDRWTATPLTTPGEGEEDPMATAQVNASRLSQPPKSEKAKGKMRERSESAATVDGGPNAELVKMAAGGVGPNGYVPTQEWVASWQRGLPLDPILLAISELLPTTMELQAAGTPGPSRAVFNYLRGASLENVLGKAPPHVARKFQWSIASSIWLTSMLWGDIYVSALPNFAGTSVKLFGVKQAALTPREQALKNVSNRFMSFVGGSGGSAGGAREQEESTTV